MSIEVQVEFIAKTTVRTIAYVHDDDGNLVDPTASIKATITDSDGTVVADAEDMSKTATGTYEHFLYTTTSFVKDWYQGEVATVDGVGATAKTSVGNYSFRLK